MKAGAVCLWTVQRCREHDFQRFLGVDGEAAAASRVKELCEVSSRRELDRDPAAEARWDQRIRKAYLRYQMRNERGNFGASAREPEPAPIDETELHEPCGSSAIKCERTSTHGYVRQGGLANQAEDSGICPRHSPAGAGRRV